MSLIIYLLLGMIWGGIWISICGHFYMRGKISTAVFTIVSLLGSTLGSIPISLGFHALTGI